MRFKALRFQFSIFGDLLYQFLVPSSVITFSRSPLLPLSLFFFFYDRTFHVRRQMSWRLLHASRVVMADYGTMKIIAVSRDSSQRSINNRLTEYFDHGSRTGRR